MKIYLKIIFAAKKMLFRLQIFLMQKRIEQTEM